MSWASRDLHRAGKVISTPENVVTLYSLDFVLHLYVLFEYTQKQKHLF